MRQAAVVFHINLIQDVSVVLPILTLTRHLPFKSVFLISPNFLSLDVDGRWQAELRRSAAVANSEVILYDSFLEAVQRLSKYKGICVAASESDLKAHKHSHDLFRALPPVFLRITLQHGFECVGFLHNAKHTAAVGGDVRFAADVIVGWQARTRLSDIAPSQAAKLYVAGPPQSIERPTTAADHVTPYRGLVCENTHSVRFVGTDSAETFVASVELLGRRLASIGTDLKLRPHPAGRFIDRMGGTLPPGVVIDDTPSYKADFTQHAFALSAPSTVLIDLMLAGVPVAIWQAAGVDASNYGELPKVHNAGEAWSFISHSATLRGELLARQAAFLASLEFPKDVAARYLSLLSLAGTR